MPSLIAIIFPSIHITVYVTYYILRFLFQVYIRLPSIIMTSLFEALFHRVAIQNEKDKGDGEVLIPDNTSTPARPSPSTTLVNSDSPGDTVYHSMAETSTTLSVNDISSDLSTLAVDLGPQNVPFMMRGRARSSIDTPNRSSDGSPALWVPKTPKSASIRIVPDVVIEDDEDEEMDMDLEEVSNVLAGEKMAGRREEVVFGLSKWRVEQLKYAKRAVYEEGGRKGISGMHGPLSLPYSRNPRYVLAPLPSLTLPFYFLLLSPYYLALLITFLLLALPIFADA
jgi:hypothetical protein